jgi:hypothetical protein
MGAALIQADRRQRDRQTGVMLKLIGVFCDSENAPKMLNLLRNYNIELTNSI